MSDELTPRQPLDDRIDRLTALVLEIKATLDARKFDTRPMLEEIRNTVLSINSDVAELKIEMSKLRRSYMSMLEQLGDLAGQNLDFDRRVRELESKK